MNRKLYSHIFFALTWLLCAGLAVSAPTAAAQSILSEARPQLVADARAHGLRISEASVDLASGQRQDSAGTGSGGSPSTPQGTDGQSHQSNRHPQSPPQGEPDFYHSVRKVDSAAGESSSDSASDDAGYA